MATRRLALLAAAAGALAAGGEADLERAVSPDRLRHDLEQGARLFRRHPDPVAARAYARAMTSVVVTGEGEPIETRDPWLADAVDRLESLPEPARRTLEETIAEHLAARAALVATDRATGEPAARSDVREDLDGVLQQAQFATAEEDPRLARAAATVRERIQSAWARVRAEIRRIFSGGDDGDSGAWTWIRTVATLVLSAAGVTLLVWIVARTLLRAALDSARNEAVLDLPEDPPRPAEMEREALALSQAGDLRGAVRALYLSLLGRLHLQGAIVYDRHRTNREYLAAMRADAVRTAAFSTVVDRFDRTWYGRSTCTPEELEAFSAAVRVAGASTGAEAA